MRDTADLVQDVAAASREQSSGVAQTECGMALVWRSEHLFQQLAERRLGVYYENPQC